MDDSNYTTMAPEVCYWDDYKCANVGKIMPFVNEKTWPIAARATLYLLGLLWCFLGVAIIADSFMCAIEKITSKTTKVRIASTATESGMEEIEVAVWNSTVANLTLMALGSSAPEILLSVFEVILNDFYAGELGPSTIVGSAAFNLLVITAVCVFVIPSPEVRRVKAFMVFGITSFFAVFAYIWLLIILKGSSPNYIDLWEAIITFLFFPVLVILAYLADKNFFRKKKREAKDIPLGFERGDHEENVKALRHDEETEKLLQELSEGQMTDEKMRKFVKHLSDLHPNLTEEDIATLATAKLSEETHHTHLWYRINATRTLGGNPGLTPNFSVRLHEIYESMKSHDEDEEDGEGKRETHITSVDLSRGGSRAVVEFTAAQCAVMENEKRVRIGIRRTGKKDSRVIFRLETIDGTAEAVKDYVPYKETLVFEKEEILKHIDIEIIDDNEWEPDEVFFVKLSLDPSDVAAEVVVLGKKAIQEITIINDDEPGTFEFSKPSLLFKESAGRALIPIERHNGGDGQVEVKWRTEDMTAQSGKDFDGGESTITFEHGEMTKTLEIPIFDDKDKEKDECFRVELLEVSSQGAKIGRIKKSIITIVNDDDFNGMVSRLVDMTNMNMDALRVDSITWKQKFRNAMNVNGGDLESATSMDYVMHLLTFGWKVIFAIVPPVSIWGGWLSFIVSLIMIGALTVIVGDLASIMGCLFGLNPSVTAITFVALGTSLPDLFASKQAAINEKYADFSIGNVTGSNSVNVFLGLGLSWLIAASYWAAQGKRFYVPAGDLAFSVVIYSVCALCCIGLLLVRRFVPAFGKGELGGPKALKIFTAVFFCFLWIFYILICSMQSYGHIKGF